MRTVPKQMLNVTFRWLEGDDIKQIEPRLAARGWASLNPQTSRVLAAYDENDQLIGFNVCQLMPYLGPAEIDREWYGSGLMEEMADHMHEELSLLRTRGVILVADNPIVAKVAADHGMTKVDSPVFFKVGDENGV